MAGETGGTSDVVLNRLQYAAANKAADISTATTSDLMFFVDVSDDYEVKKGDGDNIREVMGQTATADEVNAVADVSGRVITSTAATLALTAATHGERTVVVNKADGAALTLPAASGSGSRFKVIIGTAISSNSTTIKTAAAADHMYGIALGVDDDGEGATGYTWKTDSGDDTVTLDGAASGGEVGDYFIFEDFAANKWLVTGFIKQSGGSEVTPFSATVS